MALTVGPRLAAFFDKPLLAVVCTLSARGTPEMTPIWYEWMDGYIWFNGDASRQWLGRMADTRSATFFLLDSDNGWRWAQVYGRVVEDSLDPESKHFGRVAARYGRPLKQPVANRRYVRVEITTVKGHDGSPSVLWDVARDS
jgi:Pyridoxamine 5'-phosphate oxidase